MPGMDFSQIGKVCLTVPFHEDYEEVVNERGFELNDEQQQSLKEAYRKASKICHPDIVSDELKDQAHKIMSELNIAKKKNDLDKVKEILHTLQSCGWCVLG